MNSLKTLKMKKAEGILATQESIRKVRTTLEKKTEKDFRDFARSRQNVRELAHKKYLD